MGYTPVCQCGPALHHIEKSMHQTKEQLYEHIDASHQVGQRSFCQSCVRNSFSHTNNCIHVVVVGVGGVGGGGLLVVGNNI